MLYVAIWYVSIHLVVMRVKEECSFSKNTQISNFMKIPPVGAELFHADGQKQGHTDRETDRRS